MGREHERRVFCASRERQLVLGSVLGARPHLSQGLTATTRAIWAESAAYRRWGLMSTWFTVWLVPTRIPCIARWAQVCSVQEGPWDTVLSDSLASDPTCSSDNVPGSPYRCAEHRMIMPVSYPYRVPSGPAVRETSQYCILQPTVTDVDSRRAKLNTQYRSNPNVGEHE